MLTIEKYFKITTDIFVEAITYSRVGDVLAEHSLSEGMALIPQATKTSVLKIIEFTAIHSADTYLKQINNQDSVFCLKITQLICIIGVKFNIFILENNDYSKVILKLLIMCISHQNRKISWFAFDFWTNFRAVIGNNYQNLVAHLDCSFITDSYMEILKLLLNSCRRVSLTPIKDTTGKGKKIKVLDLDDEDGGTEEEDDVTRMSLRDYRANAEDMFYAVYDVMMKLRGEEGAKEVLTKIAVLLNQPVPQKETNEYIIYATNCEVAIIAITGMVDLMDLQTQKNPYVCELLKAVMLLPEEEIITSARSPVPI